MSDNLEVLKALSNVAPRKKRGFAAMSPEKRREIAEKGGKAAHLKGTAHEWTSSEARDAGRTGGKATSLRRHQPVSTSGNLVQE